MVDWESPVAVDEDQAVLLKLIFTTLGVMLWEYVSTFDYEWGVWTGQHKYLWTVWVYSSCRLMSLMWLVIILTGEFGGFKTHCTAMYLTSGVFVYCATSLASLMIAFRVIAIWERSRFAIASSYGLVAVCFAINLDSLRSRHAKYEMSSRSCVPYAASRYQPDMITILATDLLLAAAMLIGLFRMEEARRYGVARYLYRQSMLWMALLIMVEVPSVVLGILSLNGPLAIITQPVQGSALCICACRMYRGLTDYAPEPESLRVPTTIDSIPLQARPMSEVTTLARAQTEYAQKSSTQMV